MSAGAAYWRKSGSAWVLEDDHSTVYCRRIGRSYKLIARNSNPLQEQKWLTLGTYRTLTQAKQDGLALMSAGTDRVAGS